MDFLYFFLERVTPSQVLLYLFSPPELERLVCRFVSLPYFFIFFFPPDFFISGSTLIFSEFVFLLYVLTFPFLAQYCCHKMCSLPFPHFFVICLTTRLGPLRHKSPPSLHLKAMGPLLLSLRHEHPVVICSSCPMSFLSWLTLHPFCVPSCLQ